MAVTYSSSQMPSTVIPRASVWGVQTAFASYSGIFSASASDVIQMLKLPRNAVVDLVRSGGFVGATVAALNVGDDAADTAAAHGRYGIVSLSNVASTFISATGQHAYSLSDDDKEVTLQFTGIANTSASGSASVWMQAWYHMP